MGHVDGGIWTSIDISLYYFGFFLLIIRLFLNILKLYVKVFWSKNEYPFVWPDLVWRIWCRIFWVWAGLRFWFRCCAHSEVEGYLQKGKAAMPRHSWNWKPKQGFGPNLKRCCASLADAHVSAYTAILQLIKPRIQGWQWKAPLWRWLLVGISGCPSTRPVIITMAGRVLGRFHCFRCPMRGLRTVLTGLLLIGLCKSGQHS